MVDPTKAHNGTPAPPALTETGRLRRQHEAQRGTLKYLFDENRRLERKVRELEWLVAIYGDKHDVMVEKIEDLTPECEHCVEGEALCPSCAGTGSKGARPDDCGIRFTCHRCNGSGSVKCSECGKEAGNAIE